MKAKLLLRLLLIFFISFIFLGCESKDEYKVLTDIQKGYERIDGKRILPYFSKTFDIKAKKPYKFVYIAKDEAVNNPYWREVEKGVKEAEAEYNVQVDFVKNTTEDIKTQSNLIKSYIGTDVNGLIVAPIDSCLLTIAIDEFSQKQAPVIIHDTILDTLSPVTQIAFDNYQAGYEIGSFVAKKLKNGGKVAILEGIAQNRNSNDRRNGMLDGLSSSKIEITAIENANWNKDKAYEITKRWLKDIQGLDAILAVNDYMALGALKASKEANLNLIITGFDMIDEIAEAIKKGDITLSINQEPKEQAKVAIQLMIRHLEQQEMYEKVSIWQTNPLITKESLLKKKESKIAKK